MRAINFSLAQFFVIAIVLCVLAPLCIFVPLPIPAFDIFAPFAAVLLWAANVVLAVWVHGFRGLSLLATGIVIAPLVFLYGPLAFHCFVFNDCL